MSSIAAFVEQLQDEKVAVRARAAERLCQMGEAAGAAAPALVRATGDEELVSQWAVASLEELGPPSDDSAAELAELSASTSELVAYWAITLLGRLGPSAMCIENALVTALSSSPHQAARERSAWALGKIGAQSAAAGNSLRQASQASEPRLAELAARALAACGE